MPSPDQLRDLRQDLHDYIVANGDLPEFVDSNVILADTQETPEDFQTRRDRAVAKTRHKVGLVLYEGPLTNDGSDGDLILSSQHLIELYRSPQRSDPRASNRARSSEQLLIDLIRCLHGWSTSNNAPWRHCHFDLQFRQSVPLADSHYEAHLLTYNAVLVVEDYEHSYS